MSDAILGDLIKVIPPLAWVGFTTLVYLTLRGPVVRTVLPKLSSVKGMGIEVTLVEDLIDKAAELRGQQGDITAHERRGVLRRLEHAAAHLKAGRILWVDDNPQNNRFLVQLFEQAGMRVDLAESTKEALHELHRRAYDLLITDVQRGDVPDAGLLMLQELRSRRIEIPVIVFAGRYDPARGVDPAIFAYTNDVDDVIHYVIDVMERIRLR